jgi:hypothetical protein
MEAGRFDDGEGRRLKPVVDIGGLLMEVADHPEVIALWLEFKHRERPPLRIAR